MDIHINKNEIYNIKRTLTHTQTEHTSRRKELLLHKAKAETLPDCLQDLLRNKAKHSQRQRKRRRDIRDRGTDKKSPRANTAKSERERERTCSNNISQLSKNPAEGSIYEGLPAIVAIFHNSRVPADHSEC